MRSSLFRLGELSPGSQLLIASSVGLVLGVMSYFTNPLWVLGSIAVVGFIVLSFTKPEYTILSVFVLISSIFPEKIIPTIPIGPFQLYITDAIYILFLTIILLRWLLQEEYTLVLSPLNLPLLCFFVWGVAASAFGLLYSGVDISKLIPEVRDITYYLIFFIVINLVRTKEQLKPFIQALLLLATINAIFMIVQFVFGEKLAFIPGRIEVLNTQGEVFKSVTRITDSTTEGLLITAVVLKTIMLFTNKPGSGIFPSFMQWLLLAVALILTFNRTQWATTGAIILITVWILKGKPRTNWIYWMLILLCVLPLIFLAGITSPDTSIGRNIIAVGERFLSIINGSEFDPNNPSSTFLWRSFEYNYAIPQIIRHPVLGMGLGARYRPLLDGYDYSGWDGRHYLHNAHIWIMVKTGLVGYGFFLWWSLLFLKRGFSKWRTIPDLWMSHVVLGTTLSYLGIFVGSITIPMLMTQYTPPVIGSIIAVNEIAYRLFDVERLPPVQA